MKKIGGLEMVLRNLNKVRIEADSEIKARLMRAALLVKRRSLEKTPIDTGNLRGSAYVEVYSKRIGRETAEIGYTAAYAAIVHERQERKDGSPIQFSAPGTGAKFLERALVESENDIKDILSAPMEALK